MSESRRSRRKVLATRYRRNRQAVRHLERVQMRALAWALVAAPLIFLLVGRGFAESLAGPVVGGAMLLWQRRHPVRPG